MSEELQNNQPKPRPPGKSMTSVTVTQSENRNRYQDGDNDHYHRDRGGSSPDLDKLRFQIELDKSTLDNKLIDSQIAITQENWIKSYWRPACGWLYIFICFMDFFGFPLLVMIIPSINHIHGINSVYAPWVPLTLQGAGTFHLAFLAILGVAAWTRGSTQKAMIEK